MNAGHLRQHYFPFVEQEVPIYPINHMRKPDTDHIALALLAIFVIALVGFGSEHADGVISVYNVILTLAGVLAFVCLFIAIHSLVMGQDD